MLCGQEYKSLVENPPGLGLKKDVSGKIKDFRDNDIVFVRMKGSPWWPARIAPDHTGSHLIGKKFHVIFCERWTREALPQFRTYLASQ